MVSSAESHGLVMVIHGCSSGQFPVAGARVGNVRRSLVHALNIPESAFMFVNGIQVVPSRRLQPDDRLEFCVRHGKKGGAKTPNVGSSQTTARVGEIIGLLKEGIARDNALMADRLNLALDHGQLAIELKELLTHGQFTTYLKTTFPKSYQSVNRWMKLARNRIEVQRIRSSNPDKTWSVQGMLDHLDGKTASPKVPTTNPAEVALPIPASPKVPQEVVQAVPTLVKRPEQPEWDTRTATRVERSPRNIGKKTPRKPKKAEAPAARIDPKPVSRFEVVGSLRVNVVAPEGTSAEELREILDRDEWLLELKSRPDIGISMEYVVVDSVTTPKE